MENAKRILVTGCTGSIGGKLCHYLAGKGYNLLLASRNIDKLLTLREDILKQFNVEVSCATMDFTSNTFIELVEVCKKIDKIHGLVLMTPKIEPTANCFPEDNRWREVFTHTFVNPLTMLREVIPFFDTSIRSKVVIISGISSIQALSNYATNNVIRMAWLGQAKTLALYYADKKIHFNTLSLGGVMTDAFIKKIEDEAEKQGISYEQLLYSRVENVPLKKYASVEEVSCVIENLLSSFSDHITGSNIAYDGGFIKTY